MEDLIKKRQFQKGRLLRMQTTINKHDVTPLSNCEVTSLSEDINKIKITVESLQDEIIPHCKDDTEIDTQVDVSEWFQLKVMEVKAKLQQIQDSIPKHTASLHNSVKLPRIDLPKFNGKHENWQSFQDLFLASVDNQNISSAQKLQYLKSCLSGDAAQLIQSFAITDQNYREAWGLITDRYDNKRELVQSILKRIFNQPRLTNESASSLQKLLDITQECVRSLKVLGRPVDSCDDFLVYLVTERMDSESRKEWAMTLKGTEPPSFKDLSEFIELHIRGLQASGQSRVSSNRNQQKTSNSEERRQTSSYHTSSSSSCPMCQEDHPIFHCSKFKSLSVSERTNAVKKNSLCYNCLRGDHSVKECKSQSTCRKCNKAHNTLIHVEKQVSTIQSQQQSTPAVGSLHVSALLANYQGRQVFLKTALVKVIDQAGEERILRALIDEGSEGTFISEPWAKILGLKRQKTHINIMGVSNTPAGVAKSLVSISLFSLQNKSNVQVEALVVPKVTGYLPKSYCDISKWNHIQDLPLADPKFNKPAEVDILIGADVSDFIIKEGIRSGLSKFPTAQNTIFGWVISGKVKSNAHSVISVNYANCGVESMLQKFWELEELPKVIHLTPQERLCEEHFATNYRRDDHGRFVVKLPFTQDIQNLGDNKSQARSRFKQLEQRLHKNPKFKQDYIDFMREYQALNHMELIPDADRDRRPAYYLPHHFVLKQDSTTTKFRVVFDGSAKSDSGISLNKAMLVGPTIQDDLFTLLLRFRLNPIAIKADIAKMYRQFMVDDEDANYQRILWRESQDQPLQEYRLKTVTYGTAAAPFLATRCLQQLAKDVSQDLPMASKALLKDVYVDDLLSGKATTKDAVQLYNELIEATTRGGMQIRKFSTNDPVLLSMIPEEYRETKSSLSFDTDGCVKALGVIWNPTTDTFSFTVCPSSFTQDLTKRKLLSEVAKVFDPLGWLPPCTIKAKIMLQELIPSENWRHVRSEDNPADCASRGISPKELQEHQLWWKGPDFLHQQTIISQDYTLNDDEIRKEERSTLFSAQISIEPSLVYNYSSLRKLKRVTAICCRVINNFLSKRKSTSQKPAPTTKQGAITPEDLQQALHHWMKVVQLQSFGPEIASLQATKPIPPDSKLKQLHPFLDGDTILRVGGRLHNSQVPEIKKHQIILPHDHFLTTLIIQDCHSVTLHGGFQQVHSTLQREYWILRSRDTVRHLIRKCVTCRKQRAILTQQLMGSLPSPRVNPSRPFDHCGVDYAGPFSLRTIKGRGNKTFKCYFAVFVCLSTKAIHLEAVTDLSSEAFIAAFKRFGARRGISSNMYSDCGTNFVGAEKEMKQMLESSKHNSTMAQFLSDKGTHWHFNSPAAPHQGGLWEAGVKAVKHHFRRVIGTTILTLEEFQTVLCLIEACLNSRPLCATSNDPTDYNVLTPGHFLIGAPLTALPEGNLTDIKINRLSRWQLTQQLFQHFWKRWSNEYLTTLQQRFKWTIKRPNLQVGDLVIIKDDNLPPMRWKTGRVEAVHPGADDCVRVVTLRTQQGKFKRPVAKLCPILFNNE